jgi:hypothetical protein
MATVKFYLARPYKNNQLRKDEVSIYCKVTIKGKRFPITFDEKIEPKFWDFKNQQVKSTHPRAHRINIRLSEFKTELLLFYDLHRKKLFSEFRQLAINKFSNGETEEKKTLLEAFSKLLAVYKTEKDIKTWRKYNALFTHLKNFGHTDLKTLDYEFYHAFKAFLFSVPNPNYRGYNLLRDGNSDSDYTLVRGGSGSPVGLFDDTVYKYIVNLKTFCSWAIERGYEVHPSYKKWEVIQRKHKPITLTLSELEKLENFFFTYDSVKPFVKKGGEPGKVAKAVDEARDYLVFESRTGQRISDTKRFDLKDYHDLKWRFNQRKGNRLSNNEVIVHFKGYCANALLILEKYNWKMPVVSEQKINDNIKTACKIVGIDQEISIYRWSANKRVRISGPKYEFMKNHTGRSSFITLALQSGMPIEHVMKLTGITEYNTINHYRGDFEDQVTENYLNRIDDKTVMRKAN